MAKTIDNNGFWDIKDNPISKIGVFPYLGRNISPELEPNKIYYVYRPADELFDEETIKSFNDTPVPLVDEHEMIGKGFTPAEEKGIEGVVSNVRRDGDKLIGDISIYSEKMKQRIESGKKDLSMGYFCSYELADGEYNGEHYDAIQRNIRANHVAVVDNGRCGSDVRVFDKWCFDAAISLADFSNKGGKMISTNDMDFEESKHPRSENVQFASKGGGSSGSSSSSNRSENKGEGSSNNTKSENKSSGHRIKSVKSVEVRLSPDAYDYVEALPYTDEGNVGASTLQILENEYNNYEEGQALYRDAMHVDKLIARLETISERRNTDRFNDDIASLETARKGIEKQYHEWERANKKKTSNDTQILTKNIRKNTASDGGCVASKDDAVNQSGLEEKIMIDKNKIAVLKDLVAMLESGIEQSADDIEIKKDEEQKVKDGDLVIKHDDDDDNKEEENVNLDEVVEKKINEAMDNVDFFNAIEKKQELISKVRPLIGDFNYSKMNNKQIAKYACDKLELEATEKTAEDVLNCYLKIKPVSKVFASDEVSEVSTSIIDKYLKGE